jgi:hypothetical protein
MASVAQSSRPHRNIWFGIGAAVLLAASNGALAQDNSFHLGSGIDTSPLSTVPLPYQSDNGIPKRPKLPIEIGDPFLSTGPLYKGFTLPWGATWQPRLWIFGAYRSAVQSYDTGLPGKSKFITEWANRLDLNVNLQLTGTERLVVGLRPLDRDQSGAFSGATISPSGKAGGVDDINGNLRELFFEGDLGSTLPFLDKIGTHPLDFGYAIGRQPVFYQNGILINDEVDSVGLVRNSIHIPGSSNARITFMYGDNLLHRPNLPMHNLRADMYGLFSTMDVEETTFDLDMIYVSDAVVRGDDLYVGGSVIRRLDLFNIALRVNNAIATDKETTASTNGTLVSGEFSTEVPNSDDIVYLDPFVAVGAFTQASRDPIVAGPLGPLGILYNGFGLGTNDSALSSAAQNVAGCALGYQAFWDDKRRNMTFEIGGRDKIGHAPGAFNALGFGTQFQQALGHHVQLQLNLFTAVQQHHDNDYGLRSEIAYQF